MDILFKMFYSFLYTRGLKGAEGAVLLLMAPLSFNIYLLILFGLSFIMKIGDMGAWFFVGGLGIVAVATLLYLRNRYVTLERYKIIKIRYRLLYGLIGTFYFLFSNVLFSIGAYVLLSAS